jgi:hypothetical protein
MISRILILLIFLRAGAAVAADYTVFRNVAQGYVAFCRPSEVDELQVIGEPRRLSTDEAQKLAALLGAEDTWYERLDDGTLRGAISMCIPHYDFKFILASGTTPSTSSGPVIAIRLCTGCRQAAVIVDGVGIKFPNMQKPGIDALRKMFDEWFPGWAGQTEKNRAAWEKSLRSSAATAVESNVERRTSPER